MILFPLFYICWKQTQNLMTSFFLIGTCATNVETNQKKNEELKSLIEKTSSSKNMKIKSHHFHKSLSMIFKHSTITVEPTANIEFQINFILKSTKIFQHLID